MQKSAPGHCIAQCPGALSDHIDSDRAFIRMKRKNNIVAKSRTHVGFAGRRNASTASSSLVKPPARFLALTLLRHSKTAAHFSASRTRGILGADDEFRLTPAKEDQPKRAEYGR